MTQASLTQMDAYAPPRPRGPIELDLSRNEGRAPKGLVPSAVTPADLARYPQLSELRSELASRCGVSEGQVVLTAGGDDALLRCCFAVRGLGSRALLTRPTFEMIPRYATLAGLGLDEVEWAEGEFPVERFLDAADGPPAVAFVVSPNNPTGGVASRSDLEQIATTLGDSLVVLDAAYGELADDDLTEFALQFENVVVVRTLSKAWGLAGLRVGCAIGAASWIARLEAAGNPYPVSVASAEIALERLDSGQEDVDDYVRQIRRERVELARNLADLGAQPAEPTEANFVLARTVDAPFVTDAMAALGIAIRRFPDRPELRDAVRIGLPADERKFAYLQRSLESVLRPEAILFDLDGVLADVSQSYRRAIRETARQFGVEVTDREIAARKAQGNANDDWELTRSLLSARGVDASLDEVVRCFESIYQGDGDRPGTRETERLCVSISVLQRLRESFRIAIVTGRPRADAERFLELFGLRSLFEVCICREDAPLKPDPAPVRLAMDRLRVSRAWMLGDTPDDLRSARGASVVPIGVIAPGSEEASEQKAVLQSAGAARVLQSTDDLEGLLQ
ncbi:MAG: aminotransferase class I/II-fold pyridoxal phosphate-dependent enzyme [Planctomycetota bacterium]